MTDTNKCLELSQKIADGELSVGDGAMAILALTHENASEASERMASAIMKAHDHVAGTTIGQHIDKCADCGEDLRHSVHNRVTQ